MNPSAKPIHVLIADDHPATREGLATMIDREEGMRVVAAAADGAEAIELFRHHLPDVVLMDLQMPGVTGLEAISAICSLKSAARIVVLTSYPGDARAQRALSAGATSYLLKTAHREEVIGAIRAAANGKPVLDPAIHCELAAYQGHEKLTHREICVLQMVADGRKNSCIARALNVTEHAVKARMKNILGKLQAEDRTHAVSIARERGFIDA